MDERAPPKYAIINTTDCPERRLIAQWVEGIGYCYMARHFEPRLRRFDGMKARRPTAIEDFGFDVIEREFQVDFERHRPSSATYEDGTVRDWQDRYSGPRFSLPRVFFASQPSTDDDDE
jgi:hypothetical protein